MQVFAQMDVRPPQVISLSKQEELIHLPGRPEPIRLRRQHLGLKMLQYVRDESHRFAQQYHHLLRSKAQLETDVKIGKRPPKARKKRLALQQIDAPAVDLPDRLPGEGESA